MTDETHDPDTGTDEDIGDLEIAGPADVTTEAAPTGGEAPPPGPPGPRAFPQHFSILLGASFVFVASQTYWERPHVFGTATPGTWMHSGTFLMALSLYVGLVGIINILQGRLAGMLSAFVLGIASLYLGIKKYMQTIDQDAFLSRPDIKELDSIETWQDVWKHWFGQFGPGVFLSIVGGTLIVMVFVKALFPSKKAAAPAPSPRRRRR